MATSPTKTVKISQTIMLDIDFSKVDSVRIVDVDLLILLKDGQRLIVPEGAVRAMMDNEFSINFKGRLFSVASLMELQTFQALRVTEVGIASKPALPETSTAPVARDVQRLDLSGDLANESRQEAPIPPEPIPEVKSALVTADQPPSPPKASTEADAQARETASTLDRQPGVTPSQLVTGTPTPGAVERPGADTALSTSALKPTDSAALVTPTGSLASAATPGLSSMWKYAVGVLGAGLAAVGARVGSKAAETVVDAVNPTQAAAGDITLTGVLALGPYQEGTQLKVVVRGVDAQGNSIDLTNTTMAVGANSRYSLKLDSAYNRYTGPIMLVIRDGDSQNEGDYRDEATGQLVNMGSLMLRAVSNLNTAGETSINLTPLTELAVRVALAGSTDPQRVPSQVSINNANTTVAKAFGLGAQQDVTTAAVKTVFDNSFDAADAGVGTKYALVLAALSGVDSLQQEGNAAANAEATLSEFAAHFTSTPSTSSVLSQTLIGRLLEGAVVTQPIVQGTAGSTTLNVAALLARQIADPANSAGQTKTLALVTSSVTALGAQGTTVEFLFDKPVTALQASDVSFSDQRYSLTATTRLDATGTHWSATLVPPPKATGSVTISFNNTNWTGNTWTWGVDLIAPSSPESIMLLPATATTPGSDSGVSNTDQISQVKTPTVRIKLGADTVAGDVVTVRQIDTSTDHPILGADGKPRNVVNKVITAKDVGAGTVDITLGDLGADGDYRLVVSQQDAAGNASTLESRNYLAYTLDTVAPQVPDLFNVTNGAINFGPQTPLGLVNAATKQAGFVLKGSGEVGSMVSLAWGNTLLTTLVNQQGEWSLSIDDSKVPADNTNSQLTLTQADVAGNVSKAKTYKVEIATAGVTAQVVSIVVSDDNAETAAGAYSGNASGVMTAGMSTDDNTPVVTVKLDRPLYNNEVIEVYDGTRNAQSTPLFTLSGDYASIQDKLYAWTFNTSNWPTTKALSAGTHRLTARVVNTYTLDVGADTDTESAGPTFVVQTLDFNQLLVPTGDGELTNLIQPGKSAGAESIASTPSNTPKLGGTLRAALGTGERLGIYDGEQYLGDATLTPVTDRTSPHAYTWEYQITQALKNGAHDLSVRLETSTSTPLVRMAMSQDMTISLPVLNMEGTVDLNGTLVVNDTGWSSSDGYSNNRTPTLTLTLPAGYQVGDRITLMGTSSAMSPNAPPIEVASYVLTPLDLDQGFARITTNALGNTGQANRVWRLWATFENTQGGVQVSNTAPVIYELDTTQPDLPEASQMSLKNDTSKGFFTSQTGQLNAINFDVTRERLQYKIDKDGKTLQDWTDTPAGIELDVGASGRNWGDGKYTIAARLVDKAGNFKPISAGSALGAGNGYINFVLDTTKPLALASPTLQADTNNNLPANASDKVTSNFLLADPTPKTETGATLQYSVAAPGSDVSTVTWYGTYLDAMGAANGLSGAALTSWVELAGSAGTLAQAAAQLKEGVYVVTRRQIDKAGNESPQASLSFKLNTKPLPITAALSNDTSFGQKVSSDVTVGVSGLEGTAGTDVVLTYTLTRYADATRTPNKQIGSPIITNVAPSNAYKPPTADGFYTLVVRSVNKAGLISTSTLNFELDTTNPLAPGAITLDASSNSARQAFDDDTAGTTDTTSTNTAPTFNVVLPSGARIGDRLKLFLNGDMTKPWGEVVLTADHLLSGTAPVPLNPLPTKNDDGVTPLDGAYTFKARLFDVAGNASDGGPAFTYTQDTQASEPAIAGLALPGLPPNFINHRDDVTFSGTGEPGAYLTLNWTSRDGNNTEVVKTFHTEVNPQGMWTLTVSKADFPPDTARLGYDSSVTVSQIDPSGNVSGVSAPLMLALNAQAQTITASITAITDLNQSNVASGTPLADDYYAVNPTGVIIGKGQTTDEHRPVLSGTLSAALPALMTGDGVPSNQVVVKVYDGETYLGNATIDPVNPQAWSYQVPTALADGLHRFRVDVFDPLTLQSSAASPIYSISSNVLTLTPLDPTPAHRDNWVITTTSKPVFQGTLKALLAVDEVVAVYDSVDGISWSLLGTVDSSKMQLVSGSYQWSFDTPKAMFGQHTYRVQIEQRTPGKAPQPLLAIDQAVKFDFNSLTLAPSSDTGSSNFDNLSNVTTPTLLLHLAASSTAGDVVVLKVQGNNVNLTVTGESTSRSTYTLSQADINAGVVSLAPPDLYQLLNAEGNPSRDGTFTLNATVGGIQVVSPLNYKLDTTAPVYTPVAKIQNLTGVDLSLSINTGYTSDKTLVSHSAVGADKTAHEQVKVVYADNTMSIVKDWLSLADFNADSLADGHYTLYTRMVDTAGNVGKPGDNIDLRLDTQAATLSTPALAATAAATQALQTDAWLNQNEVTSTLQYKLEFTEKIKGLSLSHLQLVVSGAANQWPALESVSPVELDANGYASVWMVKVKDLSQLTDANTLTLRLLNGVGVVDQAGNHNDSLSFTTTPLTVDLTARYSVSSVKTLSELNSGEGLRELLVGGIPSFTINGKAQQAGVRITGATVGVEAGQAVEVSLIGKDGDGNPVVMGSPVSTTVLADHTWTLDLDATALAHVLTDKTDYTLKVIIQDQAGNTATGTALVLKARLAASIDVNLVEANSLTTSGENGTALDFSNTDTADRFVNLKDKQNGSVGAIDPDDTGFSIRGTSNIGTGRTITVTLSKVGMTMVPVIETGTVQSDGSWSVHVSSGAVGNFTDGTWQLKATGTDADGNDAAVNEFSQPSFIVDTSASVTLNPLGAANNNQVNKSLDGETLTVSGTFVDIEGGNSLTLTLRDKFAIDTTAVVKSWTLDYDDLTLHTNDGVTTWSYQLQLSDLDDLSLVYGSALSQAELARLSLTASSADAAGNRAGVAVVFDLDRTRPVTPDLGPAVRQIAGSTLEDGSTTSLKSSTTLQVADKGVAIAPAPAAPVSQDITEIRVDAVSFMQGADQWRLGQTRWSMSDPALGQQTASLGTAPNTVDVSFTQTVDADGRGHLIIRSNSGDALTPSQVQTVLTSLFWVNTSSDNSLSQADRRFVVTYIDALGNLSEPSTLDFSVDTQAPTTLSGVTIMPIGDVVVADTLNSTTTSMAFRATIEKGQATNGRADFYVGNTLMGTVASIGASDETVTLNLNTPTTAALQSKIPAGGLVSVKLYDHAGNMTSATGNVLQYDITVPTVVSITSSTQDGGYKAGSKIQLRLEASEDMTDGSSLVLTLNTGHDASGANPAVANQQVTLTRDGSIGTLFLGEYTVADGDTSADLAVVDIAAGSVVPHDAAGNALNIGLSGLAAEATLAGSKNIVIDTTAPVLNSVTLSAQRGIVDLASGSDLRAGDTVTVTAAYDDTVFGSPTTAPTLSIGNETGITLTAGTTSGNTRTWTYTLSDSGITDTGSISVGGSLTDGVTDSVGNTAVGTPSTTNHYTADTTVTAPQVSLATSSDTGGSSTDQILNASTAIVLHGTAEQSATVTVKQGTSLIGTVTASNVDGSWSLTVTPRVVVSGLMADSVTTSTANGSYTLLTAAEVAALSAFSNDFSPTTGVATVLDLGKPVYQWVNGSQTWYLWARQGGGYHISQANSTSEWYWESSNAGTFASAPESVDAGAWVRSNVPATTVKDVGDPLNAIAQSGVSITNLGGQGEHTYTVTQVDQAGNDSAALASGGTSFITFKVDSIPPSAPLLGAAQQNGVNASTVTSGIALFETLSTPVASDIQSVTIVLDGAGRDVAKDQLTIAGADYSLNNTIALTSGSIFGVSPNTVSGVDWSYDSGSNTLLFKTQSGAALPASDWFTVLTSLRFKTTSDATQGDRTFALTYVSVAGNASASRTQTITDDSIEPQLDLDTSQTGNNYSSQISNVATNIALSSTLSGSLASVIEANSIGKITLTASNIVDSNEILVVGGTQLAINGSGSTSVNVTVNGQLWTGSYAANGNDHVWTFTNNTSSNSADAQALVHDLYYRNNSVSVNKITGADRGFSLVLTDRSNNDSLAALSTLQMPDLLAPALDLDTSTTGVNNTVLVLTGFNTPRALAGAGVSTSLVESSDAIAQLQLAVNGILNGADEKLQVGADTLNADGSMYPVIVTVGGADWNLSYDSATRTFTFTPDSGAPQTTANTLDLIQAIQYRNSAGTPSDGARTFGFTLIDHALNVSAAAVASMVLNAAQPFGIDKSGSALSPILAEAVDDNGDGVKGDVNYLYFSEPVKVSAVTTSNLVLSGGAIWGTGTVEAVSPLLLGAESYASKFKITQGSSSMTTGTTLTLNLGDVIDQGGSPATANVVFTLPDMVAPTSSVSPPLTIAVDNQVSSSEAAAGLGVAFSFTASADNAFIRYYLNGTELTSKRAPIPTSSTASMTLNMAVADWGAAGIKGLSARLEDANGNLGPASVAKSVNYDSDVTGTATLSLSNNAGASVSSVDAGDVVQFSFAEAVNLTDSMLPSTLFGTTNPTPSAVDAFTLSGSVYAKNWTVTLAAGATLGSDLSTPFTLSGVLDTAGNSGNVTVSPGDMVTSPGAGSPLLINPSVTFFGNVATDNVVNAAESSTGVAFSLRTSFAQVGDTVRFYMDGELVQTLTLSASNFDSSTQTATLNMSASDWGASGTRVLTADIARASYTSGLSNQRTVYVATDVAHWSSASLGVTGLWFDPNSLTQDTGTYVTAFSALNRATPVTLTNMSGATGPRLIRDAINGNSGMYFDRTNTMGALTLSNSSMTAGLSAQKAVFVTFNSYDLAFALEEKGIFRINAIASYSLQQFLYGSNVRTSYWGTSGPASPAPANVFTQTEVNISGPNADNVQGYLNGAAMAASIKQVDFTNAPLVLGSAQGGNERQMNGLIGDLIIADNMALTQAQRGEINAYLAEKYRAVGSVVTSTSSVTLNGASVTLYDLSARNDTAIVDQFFLNITTSANDTVRVSGADYVNTGAGDDTVYLDDLAFRQIDGGKGDDKLVLTNNFTGSSTLILADFVSNARGVSGVTADDARVNAAGWHKLYGIEAIDVSIAAGKQLLTVTAADVNQLSETKALGVILGSNDVIKLGAGLSALTEVGVWTLNGTYFDSRWSGTVGASAVNLYAKWGVAAPGLRSATLDTTTTATVVMDQSVDSTSSVVTSDFSVDMGGGAVTAVTSTTASNLLSFTLSSPVAGGVLGLNYTPSGNGWMSNNGVQMGFSKWSIGDGSGNTIDRASETTARMVLMGNLGNDTLKGGANSDLIVGGTGDDTLTGNGGGDIFRWGFGDTGTDILTDFNTSKSAAGAVGTADRLDLRGLLSASGLTETSLSTSLSNYLTLGQGGGAGAGAVAGTTLNDAVLKVDANSDGTVDQTIVLQSAWDINMASVKANTVTGMTDANGSPIGGSSAGVANTPTSSQMLQELLNRGQLLVL